MRHIHASIVSMHLAIRSNNKILRTPPPHIINSDEILPRLTRRTLAQHYTPLLHSHTRHTLSLQLYPHTHHIVTPGFVDRPRRSDCTAGQMDG